MRRFITGLVLLLWLVAPAPAQPTEDSSQTAVMMDIVRMILQQAREGRLEGLAPDPEQLRGLADFLRPDQEGYALASEFLELVRLTPEQEQRMRSFRISRDQLFDLMELALDRGLEGGREGYRDMLTEVLSRDQLEALAGVELTPEQMGRAEDLILSQAGPLLDSLRQRAEGAADAARGLKFTREQSQMLEMFLELLTAPRER